MQNTTIQCKQNMYTQRKHQILNLQHHVLHNTQTKTHITKSTCLQTTRESNAEHNHSMKIEHLYSQKKTKYPIYNTTSSITPKPKPILVNLHIYKLPANHMQYTATQCKQNMFTQRKHYPIYNTMSCIFSPIPLLILKCL